MTEPRNDTNGWILVTGMNRDFGVELVGAEGKWFTVYDLERELQLNSNTLYAACRRLFEEDRLVEGPPQPSPGFRAGRPKRYFQVSDEGVAAARVFSETGKLPKRPRAPKPVPEKARVAPPTANWTMLRALWELADAAEAFIEADDRESYGRLFAASEAVRELRETPAPAPSVPFPKPLGRTLRSNTARNQLHRTH